jgi:hypothetical protein
MDILGKAFPQKQLYRVYKTLQFEDIPIELIGTGSLNKQLYPADFDFNTNVGKSKPTRAFREFQKIFTNIKNEPNIYFIEFKFQNKDGSKFKIYNLDELDEKVFLEHFSKDISYCKVDCIIFFGGKFKEVSSNYNFTRAPSTTKLKKSLLLEAKEYYDSGNYFKSLKRLFAAAKYEGEKYNNLLIAITEFLNSYVGKVYQRYNELKAIELFLEKYSDKFDQKRVELALKNIGLSGIPISNIDAIARDYKALFEKEALAFYKYYKLKDGKLKVI